VPFSVITDSSALAGLKTSRDQSPCYQRWWGCVSSFSFTIQHRPGKRIVTEDALSRRPDLETTTDPEDMLSLPDPDEFGLPDPTGLAPPSSLASPFIPPSYHRPPMDHDGVLTANLGGRDQAPVCLPQSLMPEDELITCATIRAHQAPPPCRKATEDHDDAIEIGDSDSDEDEAPEHHDDAIGIVDSDPDGDEDISSRQCSQCLQHLPEQVPWLWHNNTCPYTPPPGDTSPPPAAAGDAQGPVSPPDLTFPEVLDHALFRNKLAFGNLFGDFPLAAALRPATPAPNLEEDYTYCMALRRSTRAKTAAPSLQAQPLPPPQPAPSPKPRRRPRQPLAPADPTSILPPLPPAGPEQRDRHVRVWKALQTVRSRPKPPVGGPPPPTDGRTGTANTPPFTPRPAYVDAKRLQDLSRFGPTPTEPRSTPSAFDTTDPVSPPWPEQLQDEWVCPTQFLDLWQPDWNKTFAPLYAASPTFAPLYAASPKWQRVWRNGIGLPRQGYFVRDNLCTRRASTPIACVYRTPRHGSRFYSICTIQPWQATAAGIRPRRAPRSATTGVVCGGTLTTS